MCEVLCKIAASPLTINKTIRSLIFWRQRWFVSWVIMNYKYIVLCWLDCWDAALLIMPTLLHMALSFLTKPHIFYFNPILYRLQVYIKCRWFLKTRNVQVSLPIIDSSWSKFQIGTPAPLRSHRVKWKLAWMLISKCKLAIYRIHSIIFKSYSWFI